MRGMGVAVAVLSLTATLTACGGGSDDEFCGVANADIDASYSTSGDEFDKTMRELADAAPDELSDDVDALRTGLSGSPSTKAMQDAQTAYEHIDAWVGDHCE